MDFKVSHGYDYSTTNTWCENDGGVLIHNIEEQEFLDAVEASVPVDKLLRKVETV